MPPDTRERPGRETEATLRSVVGTEASTSRIQPATHLIAARRRWAYGVIRKATSPSPVYGSAEWNALPLDDPRRVAACVRSAECWAQAGDDLCDSLAAELDAARIAHKLAEDREYVERAEAHRSEWARRRWHRKTFVERRAEQLESAKPRPGDYKGSGA